MIKKIENDKQKKIYDLMNKWFDYSDLNIIENSLFIYYENKIHKEIQIGLLTINSMVSEGVYFLNNAVKDVYSENSKLVDKNSSQKEIRECEQEFVKKIRKKLNTQLNKVLLKTYSLFIVNFSIEWEKNIVKILDLCDILPKNKYKEYRQIPPLLEKHFKLLFDSNVYKDIKTIREIANKIKHDELDDNSILNKYSELLLNIKINILENAEGNMRTWNIKEITDNLDERNNKLKSEGKIDISYILKNFQSNINKNWIFDAVNLNKTSSINNSIISFTIYQK